MNAQLNPLPENEDHPINPSLQTEINLLPDPAKRTYPAVDVINLLILALYHGATDGDSLIGKAQAIMEHQYHKGVQFGEKRGYDQGYRRGFRDAQELGWAPPAVSRQTD